MENFKPSNKLEKEDAADSSRRNFLRGMGKAAIVAAVASIGVIPESAEAGDLKSLFESRLKELIATDEEKEILNSKFNSLDTEMEQQMLVQQLKCHGGGKPKLTHIDKTEGSMRLKIDCIK